MMVLITMSFIFSQIRVVLTPLAPRYCHKAFRALRGDTHTHKRTNTFQWPFTNNKAAATVWKKSFTQKHWKRIWIPNLTHTQFSFMCWFHLPTPSFSVFILSLQPITFPPLHACVTHNNKCFVFLSGRYHLCPWQALSSLLVWYSEFFLLTL